MSKEIFVFGSNLAGIHGAGSALEARRKHGAQIGCGRGRMYDSYAIPTKDKHLFTLAISEIAFYVQEFIQYARDNPDLHFRIVAIGCGLAGYTPAQIGPLFRDAPENCILPDEFINFRRIVR
jgi:hypothetical protein